MILFLNKKDLFIKKLLFTSIQICFPQYDGTLKNSSILFSDIFLSFLGPNDYESSLQFIQKQFEQTDKREKLNGHPRELYVHITCATDTEAMEFVFAAISDIIIQRNFIDAGIF